MICCIASIGFKKHKVILCFSRHDSTYVQNFLIYFSIRGQRLNDPNPNKSNAKRDLE